MVDSIRPFAALIRTLSRKKVQAATDAAHAGSVGDTSSNAPAAATDDSEQLESRLRARLAALRTEGSEDASHTFVETVLLFQLGEELARDPSFVDVVTKVSRQLQADAQIRAKLTQLIEHLRA